MEGEDPDCPRLLAGVRAFVAAANEVRFDLPADLSAYDVITVSVVYPGDGQIYCEAIRMIFHSEDGTPSTVGCQGTLDGDGLDAAESIVLKATGPDDVEPGGEDRFLDVADLVAEIDQADWASVLERLPVRAFDAGVSHAGV